MIAADAPSIDCIVSWAPEDPTTVFIAAPAFSGPMQPFPFLLSAATIEDPHLVAAAEAPEAAADALLEAADALLEAADALLEAAYEPLEAAEAPLEAADAPLEAAEAPEAAADTCDRQS